jgi:hypothetical protein
MAEASRLLVRVVNETDSSKVKNGVAAAEVVGQFPCLLCPKSTGTWPSVIPPYLYMDA